MTHRYLKTYADVTSGQRYWLGTAGEDFTAEAHTADAATLEGTSLESDGNDTTSAFGASPWTILTSIVYQAGQLNQQETDRGNVDGVAGSILTSVTGLLGTIDGRFVPPDPAGYSELASGYGEFGGVAGTLSAAKIADATYGTLDLSAYVLITDVVATTWIVTGHDRWVGGAGGEYPTTASTIAAITWPDLDAVDGGVKFGPVTGLEYTGEGMTTTTLRTALGLTGAKTVQAAEDAVTLPAAPAGYGGTGASLSDIQGELNGRDLTKVVMDRIDANAASAAASSGSGASVVTITVTDGTGNIQNAKVELRINSSRYSDLSNVSGIASLAPNEGNGTYDVVIRADGYQFDPTTLVVSGDTAHTYAMTAISIPASDPDLITGYTYCLSETNVAESSVTVEIQLIGLPGTGLALDTAVRIGTSNVQGLVSFTNLLPGSSYRIRRGATGKWKEISIAADATSPYALPNIVG